MWDMGGTEGKLISKGLFKQKDEWIFFLFLPYPIKRGQFKKVVQESQNKILQLAVQSDLILFDLTSS